MKFKLSRKICASCSFLSDEVRKRYEEEWVSPDGDIYCHVRWFWNNKVGWMERIMVHPRKEKSFTYLSLKCEKKQSCPLELEHLMSEDKPDAK